MPPSFLLLHSPLVGPATWQPVAALLEARGRRVAVPSLLGVADAPPPYWPAAVEAAVRAIDAVGEPAVVVAHSGAGPLVPAIAERARGRIAAYLFVDASLPRLRGIEPPDEAPFRAQLEALAVEGVLPPWSRWFGEGVMERLVPDAALRAAVERELPRLPLAYFDHTVPIPEGWPDAPCAFLQFSDVYRERAEDARHLGWRVERLEGGHLHMLVDPHDVAERIFAMVEGLVRDG